MMIMVEIKLESESEIPVWEQVGDRTHHSEHCIKHLGFWITHTISLKIGLQMETKEI